MTVMHFGKLYIDGAWVDPVSPTVIKIVNPTTERAFASVSLGGVQDVDHAVQAAARASVTFSRTSKQERMDLFARIVQTFERREDEIMAGITMELGAPKTLKDQTRGVVGAFQNATDLLKQYPFETRLGDAILRREPIGVCGLITAWNYPVQMLALKTASALAAGCTVVAKPSEYTPISAIRFAEVLHDAGVPPGVFNLVIGDGATVGNAICSHPDVAMVSFTGSTRSGIAVAQAAAPTVKRVCQELGGKSANIILPDADLAAAARWNVARGFFNSTQSCHAPSRILVHQDQQDALLRLLKAETGQLCVGDPNDPDTTTGPVVNKIQFDRVQRYIHGAIAEGATLVCGGPGRPPGLTQGYFVQPTIFAHVTPSMTIAREEVFGPVLVVMAYATEDEAVEIANGTAYGLGGYVFSSDADRARAICERIQAGRVFYNGDPGNMTAPMGGYKQSGNGRELGVFGLEEFLEVKAVFGFPATPAHA